MAHWLEEIDCIPDLILCSSAKRTCETSELMMDCWGRQPELVICESLYLSTPDSMLYTLQTEHRGMDRVLLLAHNPGISIMSSTLARQSIAMPTAAIAIFDCEAESSQERSLGQDSAFDQLSATSDVTLTHYMRPRELEG